MIKIKAKELGKMIWAIFGSLFLSWLAVILLSNVLTYYVPHDFHFYLSVVLGVLVFILLFRKLYFQKSKSYNLLVVAGVIGFFILAYGVYKEFGRAHSSHSVEGNK